VKRFISLTGREKKGRCAGSLNCQQLFRFLRRESKLQKRFQFAAALKKEGKSGHRSKEGGGEKTGGCVFFSHAGKVRKKKGKERGRRCTCWKARRVGKEKRKQAKGGGRDARGRFSPAEKGKKRECSSHVFGGQSL